jgi:hypothetical protein
MNEKPKQVFDAGDIIKSRFSVEFAEKGDIYIASTDICC